MGLDARAEREPEAVRKFTRHTLRDLRALERIIDEGMIESGVRRIGMEQEMFLVDSGFRPAPVAMEVLDRLGEGGAYTTELARFNLEINLEPLELKADCFSQMERSVEAHVETVHQAARNEGAEVLLTGILPSLAKSDLSLENLTPKDRYFALNESMTRLRGGPMKLQILGIDEVNIEHDSVLLESCNTSCQVHLQVAADEFARFHNAAQAVLGPVLAACANSPLLFGRRLWYETRIALFQQSVDTRSALSHVRDQTARVRFGDSWVRDSVLELFEEDLVRFRALLASETEEDSLKALDEGRVPRLAALQLYNSTVYRWNRPCYGLANGTPHLRIECRALPAGPTIPDEVANAAFWIGSILGVVKELDDVTRFLDFDNAKANFLAAARRGLNAVLTWVNDEALDASQLVTDRLLPMARAGLEEAGVDSGDIDRYLGIIRDRVDCGGTGAQWLLRSLQRMKDVGTRPERLAALAGAIVERQRSGKLGHEWEPQIWRTRAAGARITCASTNT